MKIYLDFDRTLFDTNTFLDEIYKLINKYDISKNIFEESKIKLKEKGFNIYWILNEVKKKCHFDKEIYDEINELMKNSFIFIYADVIDFLKKLKEKHYEIILLTKGNKEFQQRKIDYSKVKDYFDDIIITLKHKGDLEIDYQAIFIDDCEKELLSIMKNNPKRLIYINRHNRKEINDSRIMTIYSLKELEEIL